jgi:hypothetical protein
VPKLDQRDAQADTQTDTQAVSMQEFEWLLEGFDLWKNKPHKTLEFASVS